MNFLEELKLMKKKFKFEEIVFKNIHDNIQLYDDAVNLLIRAGVSKDVIKGTWNSTEIKAKHKFKTQEVTYVDSAIGKKTLEVMKECRTLHFDRDVSVFFQFNQTKAICHRLYADLSELINVKSLMDTKFPTCLQK